MKLEHLLAEAKFKVVDGKFNSKKLKKHVTSNFSCDDNDLTSLEGGPTTVDGDFDCSSNKLTSLEGGPSSAGGCFTCNDNQLTSLEHCPSSVGGYFNCSWNRLTSLKGIQDSLSSSFYCDHNKLTSLEGAPSSVGGSFYCYNNTLSSLEHCPSSVGGTFDCSRNELTSLEGIHKHLKKINEEFFAMGNPIKSHVLGLFLITGCRRVELDNNEVEIIMNKYLPNGRSALTDCQNELISAGFEDYAQI